MGGSLQSSHILQIGGGMLTSTFYQYILRFLILVGAATSVAFLLIAWTQPFHLHSLTLHWDRNPSLAETYLPERNGEAQKSSTEGVFQKRGVGLLHSWTDSELFTRALKNEKTLVRQTNSSSSRTPKIAFMFLIQNDLPFEPLWNRFFKGYEGLYNIYIHMWPLKLSAFQRGKGVFWGRLIPSLEGTKLTPGLIANARRLLANALLDDPSNEWFALISGSCIPIRGFPHVYNTLASTNKSFLEINLRKGLTSIKTWSPEYLSYPGKEWFMPRTSFSLHPAEECPQIGEVQYRCDMQQRDDENTDIGDSHWDMWNRYVARGDKAMEPEIQYSQFKVGSQFWVMRRKHTVMAVGDRKYWAKFNKPCIPEKINCYPEEHYFPTLMNFLDPGGMHHSATLVDWSRGLSGHPTEWQAEEISLNFISELQQREEGERLFARKFHGHCLNPLLKIADGFLKD